jgi:hypothetical protein
LILFGSNILHNQVVKFLITCTRFASLNSVVGNVPLHNIGAVKSTPLNVNLKCAVHMFLADIKTKLTNETA